MVERKIITPTSMLLDKLIAQYAFKNSMTHVCNSHYLSRFAAFFIDTRTKRSVVESFKFSLFQNKYKSFKDWAPFDTQAIAKTEV